MIRKLLLAASLILPSFSFAADASADFMAQMNLARTQPEAFAQIVATRGPALGLNGKAVDEAVRFLQKQKPIPALSYSPGLTQAALSHVLDTGMRGTKGHRGTDGSNCAQRVDRFGHWDGRVGENIMYGRLNARDAVVALIVDDGVSDRYHRFNIFNKVFRVAGAAYGAHSTYGLMYVSDFAATYREGTGSRTAGL